MNVWRWSVSKNQFVKSVLCLLVAAWIFSVMTSSIYAQLQPRVSPWMHMFDRPNNELGNYLGTVRPQQNLMREQAAQAQQLQSQQRALQALQLGSGGSSGDSGTGSRNLVGTTGSPSGKEEMLLSAPGIIPRMQRNPAGFNQYLHYYPPGAMPRNPVPNFSSTGRRR